LAPGGVRIYGRCASVDEQALPAGVRGLFILLAEQFAVHPIDEMKPIAGGADHGFTGGSAIIRLSFVQPMLHVQTSLRTFEDDVTHG
jgi:hypothetical protein